QDPGWVLEHRVPFSSARKWSGATFRGEGSWLLGAPDVLLQPDDPVRQRVEELAATGVRVLLLAHSSDALTGDRPEVEPAALVVQEAKLSEGSHGMLTYFAEQGVMLKVIYGDHHTTVDAVPAKVGVARAAEPVDARTIPEDLDELADV